MLRTIRLYGRAAKLFGKSFRLDVETIPEAIRALSLQIKGFREFIQEGHFKVVRGGATRCKGMEIDKDFLPLTLGKTEIIHITPVVQGAGGKSGLGKVIAGVLMMGLGFFTGGATLIGGITGTQLGVMGIGLALTGVSQMLSQQGSTKGSYTISGSPQMANQGDPIPLVYGRPCFKNPPVISAGLHTATIAT